MSQRKPTQTKTKTRTRVREGRKTVTKEMMTAGEKTGEVSDRKG